MDDFTPSAEFEKKLQAAASAPSADPQFVKRLRAQLMAASEAGAVSVEANQRSNKFTSRGNITMRTRILIPALLAVVAVVVVAFFALHTTTTVSAQQILERASAVQSAAASAQGIWHTRIQIYQSNQALGGDNAGTTTTVESFVDLANGLNRTVTEDAAGKVTEAFANDESYTYSTKDAGSGARRIHCAPLSQDSIKKMRSVASPAPTGQPGEPAPAGRSSDPATSAKALFDQFRDDPRVVLQGKETWTDGSQAYVLVDHAYQTQKALNGQAEKTYTGSMTMVFNTQTYQLLETQTAIRQAGKDIVIDSARFLVDEVLPAGSKVAWDLSDLKGATIVDQAQVAQSGVPQIETLSEHELALRARAYVLKTIPAGFTMTITAVANQPKGQDYAYEINYDNAAKENFGLQAVGVMAPGFIESNFYDGSYKSASGLVIHYSTSGSSSQSGKEHTSAMLTVPEGDSFLLISSMTRTQVQTLVEDLVPAK